MPGHMYIIFLLLNIYFKLKPLRIIQLRKFTKFKLKTRIAFNRERGERVNDY